MKQFAFLITVLLMVFSLFGCRSSNTETTSVSVDTGNTVGTSHAEESNEPQSTDNMQNDTTPSTNPDLAKGDPSVEESGKDKEETTMRISVKSAGHEIIYELNNSQAARELYAQLPLTTDVEPFSNNEMTFYPPQKLNTADTPLSGGEPGSLSYYAPWGDVVMFYAPCSPNGSLYEIGTVVSGKENIVNLSGSITVSAVQ